MDDKVCIAQLYEERNWLRDMLDQIGAIPEVSCPKTCYHRPVDECIVDGVQALADDYTERLAENARLKKQIASLVLLKEK